MRQDVHFGTDGWRSTFDTGFTEENVARVADAYGRLVQKSHPGARIYVGYDTRRDADQYAKLAAQVAASYGLEVIISNKYCPTPALCWTIANDDKAVGGLMLTASHNPGNYLGIKVRMQDGGASPEAFTNSLEELLPLEATNNRAHIIEHDIVTPYLENLEAQVDKEKIKDANLSVIHDSMYGASQGYMANLFKNLNIEFQEIHADRRTDFGGLHPEPIKPWTDECADVTRNSDAIAGFINDGDADRIGAVDEDGTFVSPHVILCLLMDLLVQKGEVTSNVAKRRNRVVVTKSHSMLVKRQAQRLGLEMTVKPVGFKWIYEEMLKGDVLIGGEESGGIGIPSHVLERDGLYCNLLLCELMARTKQTLKELVQKLQSEIGPLYYARRDLSIDQQTMDCFLQKLPTFSPDKILDTYPISIDHEDGVRIEFDDDSWILMRPSGTEPLVRVYAEADTIKRRDELLDYGEKIVKD